MRSRCQRLVRAESEDVVPIDPVEIVEVGGDVGAFQLRAVRLIERPAFAALVAVNRVTDAAFALPPIETGEMAACRERRPDDAVGVDVDAPRIESGLGHAEHFGTATLRRIAAPIDAHQIAREAFGYAPDRVVDGTRDGRVEVEVDLGIE